MQGHLKVKYKFDRLQHNEHRKLSTVAGSKTLERGLFSIHRIILDFFPLPPFDKMMHLEYLQIKWTSGERN